jgi:hypothetical protein
MQLIWSRRRCRRRRQQRRRRRAAEDGMERYGRSFDAARLSTATERKWRQMQPASGPRRERGQRFDVNCANCRKKGEMTVSTSKLSCCELGIQLGGTDPKIELETRPYATDLALRLSFERIKSTSHTHTIRQLEWFGFALMTRCYLRRSPEPPFDWIE